MYHLFTKLFRNAVFLIIALFNQQNASSQDIAEKRSKRLDRKTFSKAKKCGEKSVVWADGICYIKDTQEANEKNEIDDNNGIGLNFFTPPIGLHIGIFYDYNLKSVTEQIHIEYQDSSESFDSVGGDTIYSYNSNSIIINYRKLNKQRFFIGIGGKIEDNKLTYHAYNFFRNLDEIHSSTQTLSLIADLGWQGSIGYYFNIGIEYPFLLYKKTSFDKMNIPDFTNHRSSVNDAHDALIKKFGIFIGFAWYLSTTSNY